MPLAAAAGERLPLPRPLPARARPAGRGGGARSRGRWSSRAPGARTRSCAASTTSSAWRCARSARPRRPRRALRRGRAPVRATRGTSARERLDRYLRRRGRSRCRRSASRCSTPRLRLARRPERAGALRARAHAADRARLLQPRRDAGAGRALRAAAADCSRRRRRSIPSFPQVQYSLGVAYFNAQQFEQGGGAARARARRRRPATRTCAACWRWPRSTPSDYARAAELLATIPGATSDPSLQYAYGAGARAQRPRRGGRGDLPAAARASTATRPSCTWSLGQAHAQQGDYAARRSSRSSARSRSSPTWPRRTRALGLIYLKQGRLAEAEQALRRELEQHARRHDARSTARDRARPRRASPTRRSPSCARCCGVRPGLRATRATCSARSCSPRAPAEQAVEQLEAAARLAPEDANVHYQLGQAYQKLGRAERRAQGVRGVPAAEGQEAGAVVRSLSSRSGSSPRLAMRPRRRPRRRPRQPRPERPTKPAPAAVTPATAEALNAALQRADAACAAKRLDEAASLLAAIADSRRRCGRCCGSRALRRSAASRGARSRRCGRARALAPNSEDVLSAYAQVALAARAPVPAILTLEPLARMLPDGAAVPLPARRRADAGGRHAERRRRAAGRASRSSRTARCTLRRARARPQQPEALRRGAASRSLRSLELEPDNVEAPGRARRSRRRARRARRRPRRTPSARSRASPAARDREPRDRPGAHEAGALRRGARRRSSARSPPTRSPAEGALPAEPRLRAARRRGRRARRTSSSTSRSCAGGGGALCRSCAAQAPRPSAGMTAREGALRAAAPRSPRWRGRPWRQRRRSRRSSATSRARPASRSSTTRRPRRSTSSSR